ncbi:MAG: hypothetical protein FWD32_00010 [Firmicutes bacterium]|nr:hypothetical protein [Bacillota bacterium]
MVKSNGVKKYFASASAYYKSLIQKVRAKEYVGIINEWIIDNFPTLVEGKNAVNEFFADKKNRTNFNKYGRRLVQIINEILERNKYNTSFEAIVQNINKYQSRLTENFSYVEIALIKPIIIFSIIKRVSLLCATEKNILQEKAYAANVLKKIEANREKDLSQLVNIKKLISNPVLAQEVYQGISELGYASESFFAQLIETLENNKTSLNEVLTENHKNSIDNHLLVENLFKLLKGVMAASQKNVVKNLSVTEKELNKDAQYAKMSETTKESYRNQIYKLRKKKKEKEIDFARALVTKGAYENTHIGFLLFKTPKFKLRVFLYLTSIFVLTIGLTAFASLFFTSHFLLAATFLLIPISQLVIEFLNKAIHKICRPKMLPKMDFSQGIPKEYATMTVIPTLIKDTKKIDKMFSQLEKYYLANQSDNTYYTLLADCCQQPTVEWENDNNIKEHGLNACDKLNKKYGKEIFYFAYRKRQFVKSENAYLGYERKRGALLHLNRLLLNKFSKEEINNFFICQTLTNLHTKIKYIVTLDTESELIVNSLFGLVSTMAHPLNAPVIDPNLNKVVSGYAIMQPKISIDTQSAQQSLYVKLFGGEGGFDPYNPVVANFYQDAFGQGSFMGKGIYDLAVCDKILFERFADCKILSHDLIESNYLRSAVIADVEIIDDFPSKFLPDMSRHHRWARGDTQTLPWLVNTKIKSNDGKKQKNPTDALGKWKIFDNFRRMFLDLSIIGLVFLALLSPAPSNLFWLIFAFGIMSLSLLSYCAGFIKGLFKPQKLRVKHYNKKMPNFIAILVRIYSNIATIPYRINMYLNAFCRSFYRMTISKKHLLNWQTAEEAEKTIKHTQANYVNNFKFNYLVAISLFVSVLLLNPINLIAGTIIALVFISAPFVMYKLSSNFKNVASILTVKDVQQLNSIAKKTWAFFEDSLKEETHYLIPDNFQDNREYKFDFKTSATNIGFSLTSVICAYKMQYIDSAKCIHYIDKITATICDLPKWNGNLYNWYNINSLTPMWPQFVSSVDSGNLVTCLITTKEFLKQENQLQLASRVKELIDQTDLTVFYNEELGVFSLGYNQLEGIFSPYNYNKFASESRLLSFTAIAKGDVPVKHWFFLDKALTKHKNRKGLSSWSGSLFEYYMPLIFMRSYKDTIIDESYGFAHFCQMDYMTTNHPTLPWGISECAYDSFDEGVNYKYRAFSVPYLKLNQEQNVRTVISPYSSMLVLPREPKSTLLNLKKLTALNMLGHYGLYESYDAHTNSPVFSYFAHHQGIILASIANTLHNGLIQNYFESNPSVAAHIILNKEIIQQRPAIDLRTEKLKKFTYQKENLDSNVRAFSYVSPLPEFSVLSNGDFVSLLNDRGCGFIRYKKIQLNRYRKITEKDYGNFLYLKDIKSNKVWSSTYAPINKKPQNYEVVFAADKAKYILTENETITTTEIVVANNHMAELRKVTIRNLSKEDKNIEFTTYLEPTICENEGDINHRTFSNIFITPQFDANSNSLIMKRNLRSSKINHYFLHKVVASGAQTKINTFETVRKNFFGNSNSLENPDALHSKLSNSLATPIDPIMSQRNTMFIPKGESATIYIINAFGTSYEQVINIANNYVSQSKIEADFLKASVANVYNARKLNLTAGELRLYDLILNLMHQTGYVAVSEHRHELLQKNYHTQETLWRFGISGDVPYIYAYIDNIKSIGVVKNLLKAFEYFRTNDIFVDLVIVNAEKRHEYAEIIELTIKQELIRMDNVHEFAGIPGKVIYLKGEQVTATERLLLECAARIKFDTGKNETLQGCIENLFTVNIASQRMPIKNLDAIQTPVDTNSLKYFNGVGGFNADGTEYHITDKTPAPWCNVLSNKEFGSVVSNSGCGFSFAYNSQEFKISSWTGDITTDDISEQILFDDILFTPTKTVHGKGYSSFHTQTKENSYAITQFVPTNDNIKIFKIHVANKTKTAQQMKVTLSINQVLGANENKTARYILSEFDEHLDCLVMRNVYHPAYSDVKVFVNSTERITEHSKDDIGKKSISVVIDVAANSSRDFALSFGAHRDIYQMDAIVNKYKNINTINSELLKVTEKWANTLNKVVVKTPDDSFNFMVNGWLPYQALSSRIYAKAGFYQVSGAFGFRDQLQDSVNLMSISPELTRAQILENARHQFLEGDVLHWWSRNKMFGLRSRYKDDALWLIYALSEYINTTGDYRILKEDVPFIEAPLLNKYEEERGVTYSYTSFTKPVAEHIKIIMENAINDLGENGLPKMGGGDWNDGMNKIGIKGRGESVWLGFFLYDNLERFLILAKDYQLLTKDKVEMFRQAREQLKIALNTNGWDGEYYLRAYHDDGNKIGSKDSIECKIDLLSQSFAILTDVADKEKTNSLLKAVKSQLVDDTNKIVKLLTPAFKNSQSYPGYIQNYPEGIRENGGQYTHSVAWYIEALKKSGNFAEAYKTFQNTNPVNRTLNARGVAQYKTEPYVVAADIYSNPGNEGRGGWTWYTGSAGWFYRVGIETILGIKKVGNKLTFSRPCPDWQTFSVDYKFQDTTYNITINLNNAQSITLDGKKVDDITLKNDKQPHKIIVNFKK